MTDNRVTRDGTVVFRPRGAGAVMAERRDPLDALDYFPTPPWATRALLTHVLPPLDVPIADSSVWEPAAGRGHMADVLGEAFDTVYASDVFDYGRGYACASFVGGVFDRARCPFVPDWVITNPPFHLAEAFAQRALSEARRGVALFVRTAWLESIGRYQNLFSKTPPTVVALFVERVALVKGRWDPEASTATSYCWAVWDRAHAGSTRLAWIPPGCRQRLSRPDDRRRFAPETLAPPVTEATQ